MPSCFALPPAGVGPVKNRVETAFQEVAALLAGGFGRGTDSIEPGYVVEEIASSCLRFETAKCPKVGRSTNGHRARAKLRSTHSFRSRQTVRRKLDVARPMSGRTIRQMAAKISAHSPAGEGCLDLSTSWMVGWSACGLGLAKSSESMTGGRSHLAISRSWCRRRSRAGADARSQHCAAGMLAVAATRSPRL